MAEPTMYQFVTNQTDREVQFLDVLVQAFSAPELANGQRWRALDYINDRFGRDRPAVLHGTGWVNDGPCKRCGGAGCVACDARHLDRGRNEGSADAT